MVIKDFWRKRKIKKAFLNDLKAGKLTICDEYKPNILYICDRKKCGKECSKWCSHTSDIKHAKNFNDKGGGFYEEVEKW